MPSSRPDRPHSALVIERNTFIQIFGYLASALVIEDGSELGTEEDVADGSELGVDDGNELDIVDGIRLGMEDDIVDG